MKKKINIYLASGWFTPRTREILDNLESRLSKEDYICLYSPRRDGVMLSPNERHDTAIREKVFKENIKHIESSDVIVANIDSVDSYNDPGTIYEVGYAMAHHIPVIGFTGSEQNIVERFNSILNGFSPIFFKYDDLIDHLSSEYDKKKKMGIQNVLFVGSGDQDEDNKLVSYLAENNRNVRWLDEDHARTYSQIDHIFNNVDYMIAVIDDRRTLVSWMIGQAYARGIPVITYSSRNYGINVMLLVSILTHIRGIDELKDFLQRVKRFGLESIPPFDISQLESM